MISTGLKFVFATLESAVFPKWQKADPNRREEICRQLGQWEAKKILEEIDKEVKNKFGKRL